MAGKGEKNRLSTRSKGGKAPKYSLCGTNGPARPVRRFGNRKDTPIDKVENKLFRNGDYLEQSLEFAKTAICFINKRGIEYELVKPGLFSGARINGGVIFHFNFKAKVKDNPDSLVQTFFSQFRLQGDCPSNLTLFIDLCTSLGETRNLFWEVHDGGCLHCSNLIYHPLSGWKRLLRGCVNDDVSWLHANFVPGHLRPDLHKYIERFDAQVLLVAGITDSRMQLRSRGLQYNLRPRVRVSEVVEFSRSAKKRKTPTISKSKMKSETERSDEDHSKQKGRIIYAIKALCFLRSEQNLDYELVKPGCVRRTGISRWIIVHINFDAKLRDCPDDPVQTFFAQLRLPFVSGTAENIVVDCCVNLGPTDELPQFVYSGGCQYCGRNLLRHPFGGCEKLLLGCRNDDSRWLFGESKGRACFGEDPEYY